MAKLYDELEKAAWPEEPLSGDRQARIVHLALEQIGKEKPVRPTGRLRRWPVKRVLVAAAVICCLCAGGVAAAGYFLSPAETARQLQEEDLAALFEGAQSISIEQTQQAGPYVVTLLGITTGANATEYWSSDWQDGALVPDRSYAVLAVTHTDGTPMAALDDADADLKVSNSLVSPFFASPDCPLFEYNAFTMNGARHDIVQEGVRYILVETDTLEPFADKDPKLAVMLEQEGGAGALFSNFSQDASTGVITPAENADCIALLFDLPIPEDRADPEQAEALQRQWLGGDPEESAAEEESDAAEQSVWADFAAPQPAEVRAKGTLQRSETVSVTTGTYGTGWYFGDGGYTAYTDDWDGDTEEHVIMYSDDGQVVLSSRHEDTLTIEYWRIPTE